ncbi:exopolysaccharide Pel transporter PelG [Leucothrix pacifica]|uniref:Histidine kinase n=1 Tax=Leucothrix pacifica TaxID=1247513 RepID=A0A317CMP9_9GAMM|nr:exopolysaccharide Pel transporter PelG [Leucothrix pacifica]PWQ99784.1 histidine kinase [Leucothrix pacifica]
MAGIGFELKKMLKDDSWFGLLKTYAYAGAISSGPWVLSILGIMLVGVISIGNKGATGTWLGEFLVSVTWLMSFSLVLSSLLQLVFTRFMADQLYMKNDHRILPNFIAALGLSTLVSGIFGIICWLVWFRALDFLYCTLMLMNFVLLCNVWLAVIFVAGMRRYKTILVVFLISYVSIAVLSTVLRAAGSNGLLTALLIGHTILLVSMLLMIFQEYTADRLLRFDFLKLKNIYPILIFIGLFFNMGVWVDKWMFWFTPATSDDVNGVLRASVIYDLPIFLAYLSIIPGMASFLLRVETDFVSTYQDYYSAVNDGATLGQIEDKRQTMTLSIRNAYTEIIKVQGVTVLLFFIMAEDIINWLELSPLYVHLYYIDLLSTAMQVLFLATLNIFFYFNFLKQAFWMSFGLFALNTIFTGLSLLLGPAFYGYGFALAIFITTIIGMVVLSNKINRLEYITFMLQRS